MSASIGNDLVDLVRGENVDQWQNDPIYRAIHKRKPEMMGNNKIRQYAVMLPLVEVAGEWNVLFEKRSLQLKRQPGEICFPGGRIDPDDKDELAAAVRETCEELGLEKEEIVPFGPLDYIVASSQVIYPFVGYITDFQRIQVNADEVESVFCVPLRYLRSVKPELHFIDQIHCPPEHFPFQWVPNGRDYKWRRSQVPEYFYFYEDKIIWGLTARILHHFLQLTE